MCPLTLPEPIAALVTTLTALLDARQADLLTPLFQGILFAHGRRTGVALSLPCFPARRRHTHTVANWAAAPRSERRHDESRNRRRRAPRVAPVSR